MVTVEVRVGPIEPYDGSIDVIFHGNYMDEWFDDPFVKELVMEIDESLEHAISAFLYVAEEYLKLVPDLKIFGETPIEIPRLEFFVVYTGSKSWEVKALRLSDLFKGEGIPKLELTAEVIYAKEADDTESAFYENSKDTLLGGYLTFVAKVHKYQK